MARRRRPQARAAAAKSERGMVTAEIAAALPALVLVVVMAVWAVAVAAAHLRCAEAAREAARAAARGEDAAVVRDIAERMAPPGAQVGVDRVDGTVVVQIEAAAPMPDPLGQTLPTPTVTGRAVAWDEER